MSVTWKASDSLVVEDLGARCAAEKDFVGSPSYLAGMGDDMELRHLRYFVAVAEAGSLTVAAEQAVAHGPALA